MNSVVRVTVEECVDVYQGTSKATGDPFIIGTWKFKGMLDSKYFVGKAFSSMHASLESAKGLVIDVNVSFEAKEWNGKWFNDVTIVNVLLDNSSSVSDTPGEIKQKDAVEPVISSYSGINAPMTAQFNGGPVDDGGLPF